MQVSLTPHCREARSGGEKTPSDSFVMQGTAWQRAAASASQRNSRGGCVKPKEPVRRMVPTSEAGSHSVALLRGPPAWQSATIAAKQSPPRTEAATNAGSPLLLAALMSQPGPVTHAQEEIGGGAAGGGVAAAAPLTRSSAEQAQVRLQRAREDEVSARRIEL